MAARGKNPMLAKIQARHEAEMRELRLFTIQFCADMMLIAANEALGAEYSEKTLEDAKWDKSIDYSKGDLDRKLQQIMGKHFRPWEERYGSK